jgi:hypothetical protein
VGSSCKQWKAFQGIMAIQAKSLGVTHLWTSDCIFKQYAALAAIFRVTEKRRSTGYLPTWSWMGWKGYIDSCSRRSFYDFIRNDSEEYLEALEEYFDASGNNLISSRRKPFQSSWHADGFVCSCNAIISSQNRRCPKSCGLISARDFGPRAEGTNRPIRRQLPEASSQGLSLSLSAPASRPPI